MADYPEPGRAPDHETREFATFDAYRGVPLPNVNDDSTGRRPISALEAGMAAPHYGPRP